MVFGCVIVGEGDVDWSDREFSNWVHSCEPGVLTYAIFTRPKAKDEVMIYVRYADGKAMEAHDEAPEHQNVGYVVPFTTYWAEVD